MADYDFTNIVREIAAKEDIQDCKLEVLYSSNKGDGYSGCIRAVTLAGSNKSLDLVMKYSHRDPKVHEKVSIGLAYKTEIYFYETIVPAFKKFQVEYNVQEPFDNVPIYYGCVQEPRNELLALGNLRRENYDLWDRKKLMNKEHLECALKVFGKFHAISFAMQQLKPELYKQLAGSLTDPLRVFMDEMNFYEQFKQTMSDVFDVFDPVSEKRYRDKFEQFANNVEKEIKSTYDYAEDNIIIQGDCWCTNAMYQYKDMEDRARPIGMKLLDFQCVKLASPLLDIGYFFYTIAPKEEMDNVDFYMKLYYTSLKEHLQKFNLKAENIFSFEKLQEHWKAASKFGFTLAFVVRKAMMLEAEDAPDIGDTENFITNIYLDSEKTARYREQMKDLVMHFVDRNYI